MAEHEEDKEDLIRDATALVQRAELRPKNSSNLITIGFFGDGRCSVYVDQDPFYQFDATGRLRRAFEGGFLYRSQRSTLSRIDRRRQRTAEGKTTRVVLQRADLTRDELNVFRGRMLAHVDQLLNDLVSGQYRLGRAVTDNGGLPSGTLPMLQRILQCGDDFISPTAGPR